MKGVREGGIAKAENQIKWWDYSPTLPLPHTRKLITQGRISQPVTGKEVGFSSKWRQADSSNKQNIDLLCKPDQNALSSSLYLAVSTVPLLVCQMMILVAQK